MSLPWERRFRMVQMWWRTLTSSIESYRVECLFFFNWTMARILLLFVSTEWTGAEIKVVAREGKHVGGNSLKAGCFKTRSTSLAPQTDNEPKTHSCYNTTVISRVSFWFIICLRGSTFLLADSELIIHVNTIELGRVGQWQWVGSMHAVFDRRWCVVNRTLSFSIGLNLGGFNLHV